MEVLKRIVLTVAVGLLVLTTGLGTTAYALAMDGKTGHCAEHMSMLRDAKPATISGTDAPQHETRADTTGDDHDNCRQQISPGLIVLTPRMSVGLVRFDLTQAGFESDLRHLNQAETPDRPPNT
ncbi:hypothetical protein DL239_16805 [Sedimentitalea sp. CY04]|uniref:Uncharacterized protein n=1 Tax=Parasedimentitalea denitrificans TaxID=2211118 RepID=A0ABX0WAD0_9RHOB|nr:hypothetical protein [Sedimentitalea sp. CY04]